MKKLVIAMLAAFAVPAFAQTYQMKVYAPGVKPAQLANFVMVGNPGASQVIPGTVVGYSSAPLSFQITNTGNLTGTMGAPALTGPDSGDFQLSTNCSGTPAQGVCSLSAVFRPLSVGTRSASFSLAGSTYLLTGEGIAATPHFALNPAAAASQAFPSTVVGATSTALGFNFQNDGTAAGAMVPALGGTNAADFRVTDNCSYVAPAGACQVTAAFTPKNSGRRTATLTMNGAAYTLSGDGIAAVAIFAENPALSTTQAFGTAAVNASAAPVTFNFVNNGYATGTLAPVVTGANSADFVVTTTCGAVAVSATCKVTATFTPKADGARAASLAMNGITYSLTGTGVGAASFVASNSPGSSFTVGAPVGSSAASVDLTFTNSGTKAGTMTVPAMAGANVGDFTVSNTCANVAINATCTVSVVFKPLASGARTATLALAGTTYTYNGTGELVSTWDPAFKGSAYALSNSNLTITASTIQGNVRGTVGKSSGKWYWETTLGSGSVQNSTAGIVISSMTTAQSCAMCGGDAANNYGFFVQGSGNARGMATASTDYSGTSLGSYSAVAGDTFGFAMDLDNHTFKVYFKTAAGACVSHPIQTWNAVPVATWYPAASTGGGTWSNTTNFGASAFKCAPAGYSMLK